MATTKRPGGVPAQPSQSLQRRRQQKSDEAAEYVRALIMSGALKQADVVRPETIGDALGISATPAREALQSLRVQGFLTLTPGRGFQVAPLTSQDVSDLFDAQALLAGELAARAAVSATDAELVELSAVHHELMAAAARGHEDALEERNHEFHRLINHAARAAKIAWTLRLLTRYVPHRFYSAIPGWPQATVHDHTEILDALTARDRDRSRSAMVAHIAHAGELLAHRVTEARPDEPTGSTDHSS